MSKRYVSRPRALFQPALEDYPFNSLKTITVCEPEDAPQATGLLDVRGNKIFAVTEREPVGFVTKPRDGDGRG